MHDTTTHLDQALELLLEGVPLSTVTKKYPNLTEELRVYERVLSGVSYIQSELPNKEGLQNALKSLASPVVTKAPSPYLRYFAMYRGALVLPVLLVVLISAGVFVYPSYKPAGQPEGNALVPASRSETVTAPMSTDSVSATMPSYKGMARTMSLTAEPKIDPVLETVFAISDSSSSNRAEVEAVAAMEALNDASSTATFAHTYDTTF